MGKRGLVRRGDVGKLGLMGRRERMVQRRDRLMIGADVELGGHRCLPHAGSVGRFWGRNPDGVGDLLGRYPR
jgi:hypothetical protein